MTLKLFSSRGFNQFETIINGFLLGRNIFIMIGNTNHWLYLFANEFDIISKIIIEWVRSF